MSRAGIPFGMFKQSPVRRWIPRKQSGIQAGLPYLPQQAHQRSCGALPGCSSSHHPGRLPKLKRRRIQARGSMPGTRAAQTRDPQLSGDARRLGGRSAWHRPGKRRYRESQLSRAGPVRRYARHHGERTDYGNDFDRLQPWLDRFLRRSFRASGRLDLFLPS